MTTQNITENIRQYADLQAAQRFVDAHMHLMPTSDDGDPYFIPPTEQRALRQEQAYANRCAGGQP